MELDQVEVALEELVLEVQGLVDLDLAEVDQVQAEAELVGDPGRGPVEMKLQGQAEMKIFLDQAELTN